MQKIQSFNGRVYETQVVVPPGEPFELQFAAATPATLKIRALGLGVSALVEDCLSPASALVDGTAVFDAIEALGDSGVISNAVVRSELLTPITALRVTATGGPVTVEVVQ